MANVAILHLMQDISLAPASGWREPCPVRMAELEEIFRGGGWGQTILGRPSVLKDTMDAASALGSSGINTYQITLYENVYEWFGF